MTFQPLSFVIATPGEGVAVGDLAWAARWAEHKPVPVRPITSADFADYGDRILLGQLGYASIDFNEARKELARQQANHDARCETAYAILGLDRDKEHKRIEAELEGKRFDGIWARSTGEFRQACRELDSAVLRARVERPSDRPVAEELVA